MSEGAREELEAALAEAKRTEEMGRYRLASLEGELSRVRASNTDLSAQLAQARSLATTLRTRHADAHSEAQAKLLQVQEDLSDAQAHSESVQRAHDAALLRTRSLEGQVADLRTQLRDQEQAFSRESETRSNLIELLTRKADQAEARAAQAEDRALALEQEHAQKIAPSVPPPVEDPVPDADVRQGPEETSMTRMYASLVQSQQALAGETARATSLETALTSVVTQLKERQPILAARARETLLLRREVQELSTRLSRSRREGADDRALVTRLQKQAKESYLSQQLAESQVADLTLQLRSAMRRLILLDDPSAEGRLHEDGTPIPTAVGVTEEGAVDGDITFRSLSELLAKNGALLRRVKALSRTLKDEREAHLAALEGERVSSAQSLAEAEREWSEKVAFEQARVGSLQREKEMLRSLRSPAVAAVEEQPNELQDYKSHFEAYKTETRKDVQILKQDLAAARAEASKSALLVAKERAMRVFIEGRLSSLQATHEMQKTELNEVSKIMATLRANLGKRDGAAQQFVADLSAAQGELAKARRELIALQMDHERLSSSSTRLNKENESLRGERENLSNLLGNLSRTQNEYERWAKRKLEAAESGARVARDAAAEATEQAAKAQDELNSVRIGLSTRVQELEESLRTAEGALSRTQEELTTKVEAHAALEKTLAEVRQQLENREEKLNVFQRHASEAAAQSAGTPSEGATAREQVLEITIADLRSEVRKQQEAAASSQAQAEDAKKAVQDAQLQVSKAEEELTRARKEAAQALGQKDELVSSLETRVRESEAQTSALQVQAEATQSELAALQTSMADSEAARQEREKAYASVDERVARETAAIKAEKDRFQLVAQKAQDKFQKEVLAHAEAVKALKLLREAQPSSEVERLRKQLAQLEGAQVVPRGGDAIVRAQVELQKHEVARWKAKAQALERELQTPVDVLQQGGEVKLLQESNATLRQKLRIAQDKIGIAGADLATSQQQLVAAQATLSQLQDNLIALRAKEVELRNGMEAEKTRADALESKFAGVDPSAIASLNHEAETLRTDLARVQTELSMAQTELAALRGEKAELTARLSTAGDAEKRLDELESKLQATEEALQKANASVQEGKTRFQTLRQQTINRLKAKDEQAAESKRQLTAQVEELTRQLEEKIQALEAKDQAVSGNPAANEAPAGPGAADGKEPTGDLQAKLAQSTAQLEAVTKEKEALESRLAAMASNASATSAEVPHPEAKAEEPQAEPDAEQPEPTSAVGHQAAPEESAEASQGWEQERHGLLARIAELEQDKKAAEEKLVLVTTELERSQAQLTTAAQKPTQQGEPSGAGDVAVLRARIGELEAQVQALENELKEKTAHASEAKDAHAALMVKLQAEIEAHKALKATHAEHLKSADEAKEAFEKDLTAQLAQQAAETATRHAAAIAEAIQAKEEELAAKHAVALRERFEAGQESAGLRFKLLDARKTAQVTALQKQVEELKASQARPSGAAEPEETLSKQDASNVEPPRRSSRKRVSSGTANSSEGLEAKRQRQSQEAGGKAEPSG